MPIEKKLNQGYSWEKFPLTIGLLLLTTSDTPFTITQQTSSLSPNEGLSVVALFECPGRLLVKGANTKPAGPLGVKTYRVEEISLLKVVEVEIQGRKERVKSALRLSVTGRPFPVRALPPVIWIDKVAFRQIHQSADLTQLSTIVFDRSLLKDGATIAVSYGTEGDTLSTLPEKLKLTGHSK